MKVAYLACPYTHPDPRVKQMRLSAANRIVYDFMREGKFVYSPLTHNIPIDRLGIHGDWMAWKDFDHAMLSRCDHLIVAKLPGWEESKGVAAEIAFAKELGLPVEWMEVTEEYVQDNFEISGPFRDLLDRMMRFYKERDWSKYHSPKNLAMNLGCEVGEMMDHFRWLTEAQSFIESPETLSEVRDEVGDIFIVLLHFSHLLGIDPLQAAHDKLTKVGIKYPVDKCKGSCQKYTVYNDQ